MNMIRVVVHRAACLLALTAGLVGGTAEAVTIEGVHVDDKVTLADKELQLNGAGVRTAYTLRFYVAGLYLDHRAGHKQEVLQMDGPKRLQIIMLVSASSQDFNKAMVRGMRKNSSDEEFARLQERIQMFERIIDSYVTVRRGDVVRMDFIPGTGTVVSVNGVAKTAPIPGQDFYSKLLEIFVGDHVNDEPLKKRLLGS